MLSYFAMEAWQSEMRQCIQTYDQLAGLLDLHPDEKAWFDADISQSRPLPLRITRRYLELIRNDASGALRRMAVPSAAETRRLVYETDDPLAEERYEVLPRVIHRYRDRVLVLTTDACALYCRHCFRRRFTADGSGGFGSNRRSELLKYLEEHPEVHEVILSGGDPLLLTDDELERLLCALRRLSRPLVVRISTRTPVVLPSRATETLIALLAENRPVWLILQINHPAELDAATVEALGRFTAAGIPLLSQSVLLRGVNDSAGILRRLFYALIETGVKPYYLFQGDLASGTAHLRVPLGEGLAIYRELHSSLSSLALPPFAVDLPDGGGKVRLDPATIGDPVDGYYLFTDGTGVTRRYPAE